MSLKQVIMITMLMNFKADFQERCSLWPSTFALGFRVTYVAWDTI